MAIISPTGIDRFQPNRTYHVTARAIGNLKPFKKDWQKAELLDRFGNHLAPEPTHNQWGRPYKKLINQVESVSFNVMDNHLHDIVHQLTKDAITQLMSRVMARQAESFNRSNRWRGKVFSPFNATPFEELIDPTQIKDMVAYVELNDPIRQFETPYASFQVMTGNLKCDWYDPMTVIGVFGGIENYCEFMNRRGPSIVKRKLFEWGIDSRKYPFRKIDPGMFDAGLVEALRTKGAQLRTA
jgi:REP element-mobilizing transposase RayT